MSKSLPLSWQNEITSEVIQTKYIRKNFVWLTTGKIDSLKKVSDVFKDKKNQFILVRGCSKEHLHYFEEHKFHYFLTGNEALLKTSFPHFKKKSLKELIRRGKKKTIFLELTYTQKLSADFNKFIRETRHADKPQLQNLFLTELEESQRIFVAADKHGEWQGLISISYNSDVKVHTELLHKNKKAPQGTMEFLIKSLFDELKNEGIQEISLGEVPFYNIKKDKLNYLERLFLIAGRTINFAYNSKGLYNFKKKFNPFWNEVYMVSNKKLSLIDLWFLMKKTNLLNLIKSQLRSKFLKLIPS